MTRRLPFCVLVAVVAAAAACLAPLAGAREPTARGADAQAAYNAGNFRWAQRRIPYYNAAKSQRWAVRKAVEAWNRSGAGIRFKAVPRRRAKVLIRHPPERGDRGCRAHAEAYPLVRGRRVERGIVVIGRPYPRFAGCSRWGMAVIVAHELGHILGLKHERRRCAAMNPRLDSLHPSRCPRHPDWRWHCRILERDDIRGAIRLYGGRVRRRGPQACNIFGPPRPVTELRATSRPYPGFASVQLNFRRPKPRKSPAFLGRRSGYVATARRGRCPTKPSDGDVRAVEGDWEVRPRRTQRASLNIDEEFGTYCVAVWTRDPASRLSRRMTTDVAVAYEPEPY